ncbi:MAG: DUF4166 domain-containing protein [Candidatus Heimdallarchaeota archaeon]|nr:DUF4166 domain-containing protein [Candidatus Heimdallarchaeota archaeon]
MTPLTYLFIQDKVSVYRQLLGENFDRLQDSSLKLFHDSIEGVQISGILYFQPFPSPISNIITKLMKFPKGKHKMIVRVGKMENLEIWKRKTKKWGLNSTLSVNRRYLLEKIGPLTLQIKLKVTENQIVYRSQTSKVVRFRLPTKLSVHLMATEEIHKEGWKPKVIVRLPFIGKIIKYRGFVMLDGDRNF